MEKEKMIEEMAMLLCKDICFRKICAVTNHCQIKNCKMREKATLLYYFIVKKYNDFIPEGAVVLTKEEYENLCAEKNDWKQRHDSMENKYLDLTRTSVKSRQINEEQARKETAREIYAKLLGYFPIDKQFTTLSRYTLDNIIKEIGVEVE